MRKTIPEQIAANKRVSIFYSALLVLLLAGFGAAITAYYAPAFWWIGGLASLVLAWIMVLIGTRGAPAMLLSFSQARLASELEIQRVHNVVEEMAIAAGIPAPEVRIIDDPAPNAFATGHDPESAVVAVTSGLLDQLNREELQGVIAHEIAHVRNYDIRLMTRLAIIVGLIPLVADFFLRGLWFGRRRGGHPIFLLIAIVFAILAPIAAKLLELAVSREREYLADATAAQLTRNPAGLASALRKIQAHATELSVANRATEHLYIINPVRKLQSERSVFSTHPPTELRIARLMSLAGARGDQLPE